ncbi:MAG: MiaB/RimO family radical SAM methylthiotransferase [Gemmatimonadaceae bacterium]|nr:MiaB/RimO family radical SAM methylthiotransferase [Gemmatimonadaceae bacterium]
MKVHLQTIGCRANQYDTEAVRAMVLAAGHQITGDVAEADVAVINSCAVTMEAEADLRQSVRRAARANPRVRTVVMGCASAMPESQKTIAALPSVQHVIAGADMVQMAGALELDAQHAMVLPVAQRGARALLRVQDGCDEHCTFCATRIARGTNRSRTLAVLIGEARDLAMRHPEIVLTGVHIGTYGADVGSSLGELVERLVLEVPEVRFRLSSVEVTEVDHRLVDMLRGDARRLAPYLHAPLQSGSDRILKRMGRHWYTAATYAAGVERLVARMPVFGLGADVIAGFPGETEQDHEATVQLVKSLPFSAIHVFPYSARPGTAAARMDSLVRQEDVVRRAAELRALGSIKARQYQAARVGEQADVIVTEGGSPRRGVTEDHLTVAVVDASYPRGSRFRARLEAGATCLVARTYWSLRPETDTGHCY